MDSSNRYLYNDPTAWEAISNAMRDHKRKRRQKEINKRAEERWMKSQRINTKNLCIRNGVK